MASKFFYTVVFWGMVLIAGPTNAQGLEAISSWTNQDGSVFTINSIGADGSISGTYVNNAAGFGCQGTPYPANGWVIGSAITFAVIWDNPTQNCNSVTGWAGYYANGKITTNWNLAVSSQQTIYTGQDTFTQTAKTFSESLMKK